MGILTLNSRKTKLGQISMVPRGSNMIYSVKINYRGSKNVNLAKFMLRASKYGSTKNLRYGRTHAHHANSMWSQNCFKEEGENALSLINR